jgi:hypothetical protein
VFDRKAPDAPSSTVMTPNLSMTLWPMSSIPVNASANSPGISSASVSEIS